MRPPLTVRNAAPKDASAIAAVHVQAWREAYADLLPAEMLAGLSVDVRAASWDRILTAPADTITLVAEVAGEIVGFGNAGEQRDADLLARGFDGEIRALYLLADHQRRGLGGQLFRSLAHRLIDQGRRTASLWVLRENLPARSFYQALGGLECGARRETRPQAKLDEVAYGWPDLRALGAPDPGCSEPQDIAQVGPA